MKLRHTCPYCLNELLLEKKDIKPLSEKEAKLYKKESEMYDRLKKEKKITIFGTKNRFSDDIIEFMKRDPLGKTKCFCGKTFLVNRHRDLLW